MKYSDNTENYEKIFKKSKKKSNKPTTYQKNKKKNYEIARKSKQGWVT